MSSKNFGKGHREQELVGPRPEGFWSEAFFEDRTIHTSSSLGLIFTCLVFGACHLLAWNYSFPSSVERILWRIMSICCTIIPLIVHVVDNGSAWFGKSKAGWIAQSKGQILTENPALIRKRFTKHTLAETFASVFFAFVSASTSRISSFSFVMFALRLYLLVAILISLRSVPLSVYSTVNWSLYFPHFG